MVFLNKKGKKQALRRYSSYRVDWSGPTRSKFQSACKAFLKPYWKMDDVYEELPVVGTRMTIDIYNHTKKIAVEVSGRQHYKYVPYFHGKSKLKFLSQIKRDQEKLDFCEMNGITLIEVASEDEICEEFFAQFDAI